MINVCGHPYQIAFLRYRKVQQTWQKEWEWIGHSCSTTMPNAKTHVGREHVSNKYISVWCLHYPWAKPASRSDKIFQRKPWMKPISLQRTYMVRKEWNLNKSKQKNVLCCFSLSLFIDREKESINTYIHILSHMFVIIHCIHILIIM